MGNLLNMISHGTTVEEFLASFDNDAAAAAAHLRVVYEDALSNSSMPPDEELEDLDELEAETESELSRYI